MCALTLTFSFSLGPLLVAFSYTASVVGSLKMPIVHRAASPEASQMGNTTRPRSVPSYVNQTHKVDPPVHGNVAMTRAARRPTEPFYPNYDNPLSLPEAPLDLIEETLIVPKCRFFKRTQRFSPI